MANVDFKQIPLRLPIALYEACKDCQHREDQDSLTDFIRDVLKAYLDNKGYKLIKKQKKPMIEKEAFFERTEEVIQELIAPIRNAPTPGAWDDIPTWDE